MALLNPYLLVIGSLGAVILYIWTCLASSLRKIPGPAISSFTSWLLKWHEFHANRTRYVHRLHQIYGPVVRIAPNEVSFASTEGVKEIYSSGGSGYDKTEFYNLFRVYGRRTMFSTLNKNDHAKKKRVLADRYANTNVMRSVSMDGIKERSSRFIDRCSASVGGKLDIFVRLHSYAFDCVSHHLFHPYGSDSLRKQHDEEIMRQVAFDDSLQNRLIQYYNPSLHSLIGGVLSLFAKPRETPLADDLVLSACSENDPATFTLLSRMQEKAHDMDHLSMAAECLDHMAAGIDTTGDALCFLMWEISQPRSIHVQQKIQQEIKANKDLTPNKLPYLDAVVLEGLRFFPAIPMSLPRYVPTGGRTIDGFFIPEKTIVSSQAYSTHRIDQDVFPEPDLFNPDRWLEETRDAERKRLFFAFASGGRGCVGKHLALAEMKTLLVDVYSRFTTLPDETMTPSMMEMSDQLISSQPLGQKCMMRFVPL
ncbi:putative Cytochrome P450 [Seiridium cardinale]|uniref:Cytochrome P450 n=1 Tax=Seiridium cardinale TaxID=138064 RepID=A0ABR2XR29_9PEZI